MCFCQFGYVFLVVCLYICLCLQVFAYVAFVTACLWIKAIANEVVNLLQVNDRHKQTYEQMDTDGEKHMLTHRQADTCTCTQPSSLVFVVGPETENCILVLCTLENYVILVSESLMSEQHI